MNILVFDTSTETLAAGVRIGDRPLNTAVKEGFKHSETLLPSIEACLRDSKASIKDIELIACTSGPGSFTGLRIGMATAKGLSLALGVPWVGIPTLDCVAYGHGKEGGIVVPVLDARKNRVYAALYSGGQRTSQYLDVSIQDLLATVQSEDKVFFAGPDADLLADYSLERPGFIILEDQPARRLLGLAALAETQYREKGPSADGEGPLYIREPEIG